MPPLFCFSHYSVSHTSFSLQNLNSLTFSHHHLLPSSLRPAAAGQHHHCLHLIFPPPAATVSESSCGLSSCSPTYLHHIK
ncbi:hypothetical protein ERO13_A06G036450v2 [Gossypium hirsutum]|uniref:Uncharacterized protein n=2 Tax=Gossypium TaxID=3633 RepID=A0A5D2YRL4_GOSMU|nr:hypothetical protein ERO13_A06G036450v2 [Gossypium hirsutum]TYI21520.1 hypothetical protein ES332_A06G042800v1 [Gossypium tomentosum]TYJ29018.1 hypothetical protein E1A91_A06G041000v1 [Gossypium mustelinum]